MGWPLQERPLSHQFEPSPQGRPQWLVIVRPGDWEGMLLQWDGPLQQSLRNRQPPSRALVATVAAKPRPLLRLCACYAFWQLPKSQLLQIASHIGASLEDSQELSDVLVSLYKRSFPGCTDKDLADMLSHRVVRKAIHSDLLHSDVTEHLIDGGDQSDLNAAKADQRSADAEHLRARIRKLMPAEQAKRQKVSGSSAQGTQSENYTILLGGRRYPSVVAKPTKAITSAVLQEKLPPNYRVSASEMNQRWLLTTPFQQARSWSWGKWGYADGALELLKVAWSLHEEETGQACPFTIR